jgi:hypothetical protein
LADAVNFITTFRVGEDRPLNFAAPNPWYEIRIDARRRHLPSGLRTIREILPPAAVEREAQF